MSNLIIKAMKNLKFSYLIIIFICASCAKDHFNNPRVQGQENICRHNQISPKIKIASISDMHYMDPSIAPDDPSNNPYYQAAVSLRGTLLELSDPIFRKVCSELKNLNPDILLVAGDLAKDGELAGHETVSNFLQKLEDCGIKVYVVPGNNDINSTDAVSYKTDPPESVATITGEQFEELYGNFGYNEALYRDPASLSYICQPYDGLWILGIDANRYSDSDVSGAISPATLAWIQERMSEARDNNITVLAMMHYGLLDHYTDNYGLGGVIEDHDNVAQAFMNAGIRLVFTGHDHANDIVDYQNEGKIITDIQTGSLVTPPYSYRMMTLDDNFINIDSRRVTRINAEIPGGMDFLTYSDVNFTSRCNSMYTFGLHYIFGLPETDAINLAPYCTRAWKAYYAGDEKITPEEANKINAIAQGPYPFIADILNSVWTDLPPHDNKIQIKLK
jgi:3',5'-cyclic AMP phosphodiesterase CpdA